MPCRLASRRSLAAAACIVGGLLTAPPTAAGASGAEAAVEAQPALKPLNLTGTLRDFTIDHPDMQFPKKSFGLRTGVVEPQLDEDGKPVLAGSFGNPNRAMIHSAESFSQWFRDVPGVNREVSHSITLEPVPFRPGYYRFARELGMAEGFNQFFPLNGRGFNDLRTTKQGKNNYYFTYEIDTVFTYTDPSEREHPLVFKFVGDDDVWVFINGELVVDLGGVHSQLADEVNLDDPAVRKRLGLRVGQRYPLKLFFAERHTTQSNFRIETSLALQPSERGPLYD